MEGDGLVNEIVVVVQIRLGFRLDVSQVEFVFALRAGAERERVTGRVVGEEYLVRRGAFLLRRVDGEFVVTDATGRVEAALVDRVGFEVCHCSRWVGGWI
jgi:hypothetical protein